MTQWTGEEVAQQFRLEVQQRFAAENAEHLQQEREELAKVKARLDAEGQPYPDWIAERDSFLWEIYSASDIQIERNSVKVITPRGFAIYTDFVEMFGGTSVGWSIPSIGAVIVDGEPHVCVGLILIDYWDDARHAAWFAEKAAGKENSMTLDPTPAMIEDQITERERLRAEIGTLKARVVERDSRTVLRPTDIAWQAFQFGRRHEGDIEQLNSEFMTWWSAHPQTTDDGELRKEPSK